MRLKPVAHMHIACVEVCSSWLFACSMVPAFTGSVSTSTGSLPTSGGGVVEVVGEHLGLTSSVVALSYAGGSHGMTRRSYTAGPCTVRSPGVRIHCPAQPGVGANYTFVVTVDGGSSNDSVDMLSYATPVINAVEGPGSVDCPAAGGVPIFLRGVRFVTLCAALLCSTACRQLISQCVGLVVVLCHSEGFILCIICSLLWTCGFSTLPPAVQLWPGRQWDRGDGLGIAHSR